MEKLDVGWIDEFNEDFRVVRGAVDLAAAALSYEAPVDPTSVGDILGGILCRLDRIKELIQSVYEENYKRKKNKKAA